MKLRSISILLVEPENPDNIGAVGRAMKNMGASDLRLVRPPAGWRTGAKKMAMSGYEIIEKAVEYSEVEKAVHDAALVVGTTRRPRRFNANRIPYSRAIAQIDRISRRKTVVLMFGKESKGLDNESLNHCDWMTSIPASAEYPSLNLAQAVMVLLFSLYWKRGDATPAEDRGRDGERVNKGEVYDTLKTLRGALETLGYLEEPEVLERIVGTFHSLFKRAGLLKRENQMFKGISRRIRERVPFRTFQQLQREIV